MAGPDILVNLRRGKDPLRDHLEPKYILHMGFGCPVYHLRYQMAGDEQHSAPDDRAATAVVRLPPKKVCLTRYILKSFLSGATPSRTGWIAEILRLP